MLGFAPLRGVVGIREFGDIGGSGLCQFAVGEGI